MKCFGELGGTVVLTSADGCISYWSMAAEQCFGWAADQMIDRPLAEIMVNCTADEFLTELRQLVVPQRLQRQCTINHSNGNPSTIHLESMPLLDENGRTYGYLHFFRYVIPERPVVQGNNTHETALMASIPREMIHKLGNKITEVTASLDLILLSHDISSYTRSQLVDAQSCAREAAQVFNLFREKTREFLGTHTTSYKKQEPAVPQRPARPVSSTVSQALDGHERILVADDDDMVRRLIRAVLEYRNYKITEATNGEEAVRLVRETQPVFDMVILDVKMPKMSGTTALKQIHAIYPKMRSILLSGSLSSYEETATVEGGCDAFLSKPFENNEQLVQTVRHILDRPKY